MMELTNQPPAPTPIEPVLPPQQIRNQISEEPRERLVVISMEEMMEHVLRDDSEATSGNLCIYRVPKYLQENNEESYFPQTVSIGPYHHGEEHLLPMEHYKWRAVYRLLGYYYCPFEFHIDAMKEFEERARACYEGPIFLSSDEFVRMLILDGCFVLVLFFSNAPSNNEIGLMDFGFNQIGPDDPVLGFRASTMHSIRRDMIMLENQLPLFVLKYLLERLIAPEDRTGLVAGKAGFFAPLMPTVNWLENFTGTPIPEPVDPPADKGEFHFLDVLRRSLLVHESELWSGKWRTQKDSLSDDLAALRAMADKGGHQWIPCVTELMNAGFKFRKRDTNRLWDIELNNGYVEMPVIRIHDGTKILFLNLIAFKKCHTDSDNDITSYLIVMDNLINTPEDVSYLRECGIIEHSLGSDSEVANMFNTLCQQLDFDLTAQVLLYRVWSQVAKYKKMIYILKWNTWTRSLKQKYFDTPWAYCSFFAALFLLVFTAAQTYFAGYAYFKPPSQSS